MVENVISPVTAPTSSLLERSKLRYFSLADVTEPFRSFIQWVENILISKEKTRQKGDPKKILHSCECLSSVFRHALQNIHSDWIARTTVA